MKYFILAIPIFLAGCNWFQPLVEETKPQQVSEIVESFQYIKAKNGLCFGVTTTARLNTGGNFAYNNHVVNVSCEKIGL